MCLTCSRDASAAHSRPPGSYCCVPIIKLPRIPLTVFNNADAEITTLRRVEWKIKIVDDAGLPLASCKGKRQEIVD
jgi:hypothetical protein